MRIETTLPFIDKQATDPDKANVAAGTKMTVSAERGAELVHLRLADEIDAPAPPEAARKAPRRKASSPRTAPVQAPPAAPVVEPVKTDLPEDPAPQA